MPNKYTDEEYAKMLPKKQAGTAILFFNEKGELLIVKPEYRKEWLVPGGACDEDESPPDCAVRETKEEIGLAVSNLQLVGILYSHARAPYSDSLKFIFSGGILTESLISQIKLQPEEITEFSFLPLEDALPLLSQSLQKSVPACLDAIKNNTTVYM